MIEELIQDDPPAFPLQVSPQEQLNLRFGRALVGDVLVVPADQEFPDDWRECDGSEQYHYQWPEFVARMRIRPARTFTLPNSPERDGWTRIVKLGTRRLPPSQGPVNFDAIPAELLPPAEMARRLLQRDE